jgi:hypothetical protein
MCYRALIILAALALSGCSTGKIKEQMPQYVGQPASALFAKLGYPTSEQTVAGSKVYIWTTTHLVDGTNYGCKIRAIVDSREIITSWDGEGNQGGCAHYASRL